MLKLFLIQLLIVPFISCPNHWRVEKSRQNHRYCMSINSDRIVILAQKTVSIHANFFNNLNETFWCFDKSWEKLEVVGGNLRDFDYFWKWHFGTCFDNSQLFQNTKKLQFFKDNWKKADDDFWGRKTWSLLQSSKLR